MSTEQDYKDECNRLDRLTTMKRVADMQDEIERLRAENELLRDTKGCTILDQQEEIERLRISNAGLLAALKKIADVRTWMGEAADIARATIEKAGHE